MTDRTTTSDLPRRGRRVMRRGSALLIVIGTLAIVSVFAAIYIAIGQGDRRVASSIEKRQNTQELRDGIASHVLGVLAQDRLDYTAQRIDPSNGLFFVSEAVDLPYTDWTMRSESANLWERFNPTGRSYFGFGPGALADARVASDPFLASTTPTFLGNPGQPVAGEDWRPYGSLINELVADTTTYIAGAYSSGFLDNRDWLQISNLAPDGRFVNLFNLRPNSLESGVSNGFSDNRVGGFDAEPGTGSTARDDGRSMRRMSEYLSLLRPAGGTGTDPNPNAYLRAFDPVSEGVWVPGRNEPVTGVLAADQIVNTPSVWTMYQRFMFMPLNQAFVTRNRFGQLSTWADPDYPAYQYADADGDGMADSRWIELVAAREPNSTSTAEREDIERVFDAQGARVFIGARVVDLSSMVNVNTATDLLAAPDPTDGSPIGATPADVDLRRLLSFQDASENYAFRPTIGLSPMEIRRPPATRNRDLNDLDYWYYQARLDDSGVNPNRLEIRPYATTLSIGRFSYDAIKRELAGLTDLGENAIGWPPKILDGTTEIDTDPVAHFDARFNDLAQLELDPASAYRLLQYSELTRNQQGDDPTLRRAYYEEFGRIDPLTPNSVSGVETNALYGVDDLSELLTYHGLNDPAVFSRLEEAASGTMPSIFEQNQRSFSPLFSNRTLRLDRDLHSVYDSERTLPGTYRPGSQTAERSIGGQIAKESMAYFALTPRKLLTTVSGHAPLEPGVRVNPSANTLAGAGLPDLGSALGNASSLYGVYRDSLAADFSGSRLGVATDTMLVADLSTRRTDAATAPYATLFYGHQGPELALRISAHAALNMKDLADGDSVPSVATLIMDDDLRDEMENMSSFPDDETFDPEDALALDFPGRAQGVLFDPETSGATLPMNQLDEHRRAVNIYGIEAMPVITEVSTFYVFHDASTAAGGDVDFRNIRPRSNQFGTPVALPQPGTMPNITINGDPDPVGNPDCLMEGIAFQLHNPFDRSISLGGDGRAFGDPLTRIRDVNNENEIDTSGDDQYEFGYYIEWNGYFFKLAELVQYYPPSTGINGQTYRDVDETIVGAGVMNPAVDFGPNDGVTTTNGGYLDPAVYPDFVSRNIVLGPGETRVFYAIADPRFDSVESELMLDNKWRLAMDAYDQLPARFTSTGFSFDDDGDLLPDGYDNRGWTGPAQEWLSRQFNSVGSRAIMVHPMNPQTGEYEPVAPYDLLGAQNDHSGYDQLSGATGRRDATQVRLWRKMVSPAENTNDLSAFPNATRENRLENDLLVDRIPLDEIAVPLDTDTPIARSIGFPEDYPRSAAEQDLNLRNDNQGYSIVKWSTSGRRDTGDPAKTQIPGVSQIREWVMASRTNPSVSSVFAEDGIEPAPDVSEFREGSNYDSVVDNGSGTGDYETHLSLVTLSLDNTILVSAGTAPYLKSDLNTVAPGNGDDGSAAKFNRDGGAEWAHPDGRNLHDVGDFTETNLRPELVTHAPSITESPRLADLLLAWGIGPVHAPTASGSLGDNLASFYADEWMTLPEAIAVALGYEKPGLAIDGPDHVWNETFTNDEQVLDNGRLRIDDYVAYINDPNQDETMGEPEFDLGFDIRRGSGVPMALGVIDRVRSISPNFSAPELAAAPVYGTVNINTAPVEVLRLLPGLAPSTTSFYPNQGSSATQREWWGDGTPDAPTDLGSHTTTPDVAAALVGYRDRTFVTPRGRSMEFDPMSGLRYELNPVTFAPAGPDDLNALDNTASFASNLLGEVAPDDPGADVDHRDRQTISGIDGLRPSPGFGSLGEILAVTFDAQAQGAEGAAHRTRSPQLDIQQFAYDELNLDGVSDDEVLWDAQLFGGDTNGASVDDYAEQLAMANGVLNTISVRSDYFAVWFVMHVYQRSDVEGLLSQDPLVPSIAKRYVMVVDRTNVITEGDQPRIVLLKEVPLE